MLYALLFEPQNNMKYNQILQFLATKAVSEL